MNQKNWLLIGAAGAVAWYLWQQSDAKKNNDLANSARAAAARAGVTLPSGADITKVGDAISTIFDTVKRVFTSSNGVTATDGTQLWDSFSVGPVGEVSQLAGWMHGRKLVEPLRSDYTPSVLLYPDYRTPVLDASQQDMYGRPDPARFDHPNY